MATPTHTTSTWRFGVFEVEAQSGELRRDGVTVKLREQCFRILVLLLEHAGQLVTRDDLRKALWPAETFVDFDHSLNAAVMKLREALGDTADKPLYIETIPKRGYRFIAPLMPGAEVDEVTKACSPHIRTTRRVWVYVCCALGVLVGVLVAFDTWSIRERIFGRLNPGIALQGAIKSVAVLPLENMSGDREQEYFSDGLTDTLITYLGQVTTLRVISRASVMRYKGAKTPLGQIARELNVDAVVEGSVQRDAGHIQISVQLLDARTDRHIWATTYQGPAQDVLGFERQVALSMAREISGLVLPAAQTRLNGRKTVNPKAYDDYLHGRYLLGQRTAEGESGARAYFDEARRIDPRFAPAYSGLADTYSVGWFVNMDLALAEQYGRKAVELESGLAEGYASIGIAEVYEHKFPQAEKDLRKAIELNPNYAMAHHWYSLFLLLTGQLTDALAANDRARQLDPYSLPINYLRGKVLVSLVDYDRAAAQFNFATSIDPGSPAPHVDLQRIYWMEARVPDALSEEKIAVTLSHHSEDLPDIDKIAAVYKSAGFVAAVLKDVELKAEWYAQKQWRGSITSSQPFSAEEIALCYASLHETQKTLSWLNQSFHDNPYDFPLNRSHPALDWLHSDPEFRDLLRRAGLLP